MLPGSATPPALTEPVVLRYTVPGFLDRWIIPEVPVPEAAWHALAVDDLQALLKHWLARTGLDAAVYRNLAVRVRADKRQVGFDPDLCLVRPAPPDPHDLDSLRFWEPGHPPPALCLEVVSSNHPYKDYDEIPARCAAAGVTELVVFDPKRRGPAASGGPHLLQVWRRRPDGEFERVHAGDGSARSAVLEAWLVPINGGRRLTIADDAAGARRWLTDSEATKAEQQAERAAKEAERANAEAERANAEAARAAERAERAAKEAALRRVAELEAELARNR